MEFATEKGWYVTVMAILGTEPREIMSRPCLEALVKLDSLPKHRLCHGFAKPL